MKKMFWINLVMALSAPVMAANLVCEKAGSPYKIEIFDGKEAKVTPAPQYWGDLRCDSHTTAEGVEITSCWEKHVVDAGFSLSSCPECSISPHTVKLYKVSFFGSELIDTFPCQ